MNDFKTKTKTVMISLNEGMTECLLHSTHPDHYAKGRPVYFVTAYGCDSQVVDTGNEIYYINN